jgi:hypothetical protein
MNLLRLTNVIILVLMTGFLNSCGVKQTVTGIQLSQEFRNGDAFLGLEAQVNFQNILLPNLSIPINHPNGGGEIGHFELTPTSVKVEVNASELLPLCVEDGELPNGGPLPLIGQNKVVAIPVGDKGITVYVTLADSAFALGVVLPIAQLDPLGANLKSPQTLFPVFPVSGQLVSAGVYSSPNAGENGIGVFADLSELRRMLGFSLDTPTTVDYTQIKPSRKVERKINRYLGSLNKNGVQVVY